MSSVSSNCRSSCRRICTMFEMLCKCYFVLECVRGVLNCGFWVEWGLRVYLALTWVM